MAGRRLSCRRPAIRLSALVANALAGHLAECRTQTHQRAGSASDTVAVRGEFVDLDGARLYYYAAGTRGVGEPVVFLHGFPASGHLWSDVIPLMPAGHRLVVVDLLGYGRSDPPNGRPLTLRAHAARVVALMDALGIARACVVGHELGGGVAQAMAIDAPTRVSRLALVDSVAFSGWPSRDVRVARALLRLTRRVAPRWLLAVLRADL